jgi:hypothetical protein
MNAALRSIPAANPRVGHIWRALRQIWDIGCERRPQEFFVRQDPEPSPFFFPFAEPLPLSLDMAKGKEAAGFL